MNGRFQKGKSGNTGGRPKAAHSIEQLARKHAPEAIKTFAYIAKEGQRQALAYLWPLPCLTAPTASHRKVLTLATLSPLRRPLR